jgi:hypothetical protein
MLDSLAKRLREAVEMLMLTATVTIGFSANKMR